MLILFRGLPGTGKTSLIKEISKHREVIVLSRDEIRNQVLPKATFTESEKFYVDSLVYSAVQSYLLAGEDVIIDGMPFKTREKLDIFLHFAVTYAIPWRIIECRCSQEMAETRIRLDQKKQRHYAKDRTIEMYRKAKKQFEPIPYPKLIINTELPLEYNLKQCLDYIGQSESYIPAVLCYPNKAVQYFETEKL